MSSRSFIEKHFPGHKLLPWLFIILVSLTLYVGFRLVWDWRTVNYDIFFVEFKKPEVIVQSPGDRPTIIHFIDPACPCTKFSLPHIADLEGKFQSVDYRSIYTSLSVGSNDRATMELIKNAVPASPAVMIFDKAGKMAYFGPYSDDVFCGDGVDFVEKVLGYLDDGNNPGWTQQVGYGCFCHWNKKKGVANKQINN